MKTIRDLRRLVKNAGGTLEEDCGGRTTRRLQAVAPEKKRWKIGLVCIAIEWAVGSSKEAVRFNEEQFSGVAEDLSYGLEDIPEDELDFYYWAGDNENAT